MSLTIGAGAGCTASNKTLAAYVGCDYTTLIKLRKKLEEWGYIQLEPRHGGKRLEVIRIIPDHLASPESWPFDQSFIGTGCLKAWHSRERKVDDLANIPAEEVGELANDDASKVGEPISETRRNLPETDPQYIPLKGETYSFEKGGRDSTEVAHFSQSASDEGFPAENGTAGYSSDSHLLKLFAIVGVNLLGSNRNLARQAGISEAYASNARNGRHVPSDAARKLIETISQVIQDRKREHPMVDRFGDFGLLLPVSFLEMPAQAQLSILERTLKMGMPKEVLDYAREPLADFLISFCGDDPDDNAAEYRALRMEEALASGEYG